MKKITRVLMIVLCITLLFSMTACKNTSKPDNLEEKPKIEDESGDKGKEEVLKGLPKKLANLEVTVLVYSDETEATFKDPGIKFEEMYGGKVSLMRVAQHNEIEQKVVVTISAGNPPDLIHWSQDNMPRYAIKELLQPINDYIDINDPIWQSSLDVMNQFKFKGKLYGFGSSQNATHIFFNKTMFENNGMKNPLQYYKEGKWDWETFRKVAKELTQDINKDGIIDQWGFNSNVGAPDMFILSNGADFAILKDDGTIELKLSDSKMIEALQFYQDGYVKDAYITPSSKTSYEDFATGKLSMWSGGNSVFIRNIYDKMKDEWDMVPFPAGPSGSRDKFPGGCSFWGLVNGAKNPEGAATLYYLSYIAKLAQSDEMPKGVTAKQLELAKEFKKMFESSPEAQLLKQQQYYTDEQLTLIKESKSMIKVSTSNGIGNFKQLTGKLFTEIKKGTAVVTAVEQYIPLYQAEIDAILREAQ